MGSFRVLMGPHVPINGLFQCVDGLLVPVDGLFIVLMGPLVLIDGLFGAMMGPPVPAEGPLGSFGMKRSSKLLRCMHPCDVRQSGRAGHISSGDLACVVAVHITCKCLGQPLVCTYTLLASYLALQGTFH